MNMVATRMDPERYARCIAASKRIRWEIDRDVLCGRSFDFSRKFLPDGLSRVQELAFLDADEQRLLSQVQGRTYAYIFGLVERFINAKVLDISREHWFGDQVALEALVRFSDEELKHQELFRRVEGMIAAGLPEGYRMTADPNAVAEAVLSRSTWSVLALTCLIELFTQAHYRSSIEPDGQLSELYRDVFLFHWREESQHAVLDELEWRRCDDGLSPEQRDAAVDDLIALVAAVDGILQAQAQADSEYFCSIVGRELLVAGRASVRDGILRAYRWQYIFSGVEQTRFVDILDSLITPQQGQRVRTALATLAN